MKKKSTKVLSGALATTTVLTSVMGATPAMAANNVDELFKVAYTATEVAKTAKTQEKINEARKAVRDLKEALKNDPKLQANLIGSLSSQLDPLQQEQFVVFYAVMYKEDKVTLKENLSQSEINKARDYIIAFKGATENEQYVPSWSSALDNFQQANIDKTTGAVEKAEKSKTEAEIKAARVLVDELLTVRNNDTVLKKAQELDGRVKKVEKELQDQIDESKKVLKVTSVSAINAKQIEVKFNREMDRSTVENNKNFKVKSLSDKADRNISFIHLQDATTAIITLQDAMINGNEYEIIATKSIKDSKGNTLPEKFEGKVVVNDKTRPAVQEIKTLAANKVEITFTEPVKIQSTNGEKAANIQFVTVDENGKELHDVLNPVVYNNGDTLQSNGGRTHVITLNSNLKQDSKYNLYVGGNNGIEDYAGLKLTSEKHSVTFKADTAIPKVEDLVLLDNETVKVTFNKPIEEADAKKVSVYYNTNGMQGNRVGNGEVNVIDANTILVKFNSVISGGKKFFFVEGAVDVTGNKIQIAKFEKEVAEYKELVVDSVELKSKTKLELVFNQNVDDKYSIMKDSDTLEHKNKVRKNFELKDKDGKAVVVKSIEYGKTNGETDESKRVIELYNDVESKGNKLTVANICDKLGREIASKTYDVSYEGAALLDGQIIAGVAEEKTVAVVTLNEKESAMPTEATITNTSNWTVDTGFGLKNFSEVPGARIKVVPGTTDSYILESDKDGFKVAKGAKFVVAGLKTKEGKAIPSKNLEIGTVVSGLNEVNKLIGKDATSLKGNTIEITLDTLISSLNSSDLKVNAKKIVRNDKGDIIGREDISAAEYSISYKNDVTEDAFKSVITIKINGNIEIDPTDVSVSVTGNKTYSTDIFGNKINGSSISIKNSNKAKVVSANILDSSDFKDKNFSPEKPEEVNNTDTAKIRVEYNNVIEGTLRKEDYSVVTEAGKAMKVVDVKKVSDKVVEITVDSDKDYLEESEAKVTFKSNVSKDINVADETVVTSSLRLTGVSLDKGTSETIFGDGEKIKFTFNKGLDREILTTGSLKDITKTVTITPSGIETAFGTVKTTKGNKIFDINGNVEVKVEYILSEDGKSISIKLIDNSKIATVKAPVEDTLVYAVDGGNKLALVQSLEGIYAVGEFNVEKFNTTNKTIAVKDLFKHEVYNPSQDQNVKLEAAKTAVENLRVASTKDLKVKENLEEAEAAVKSADASIKEVPQGTTGLDTVKNDFQALEIIVANARKAFDEAQKPSEFIKVEGNFGSLFGGYFVKVDITALPSKEVVSVKIDDKEVEADAKSVKDNTLSIIGAKETNKVTFTTKDGKAYIVVTKK